ncbi:hypothetical protein, partial [Pseudogulbenkiania ferrooxidans]|uniref:hypothetical protein n=1 Tax=Pseudogulbenkiania ferrooxidans TaxID=549169 RepID=UPI00256FE11C
MQLIVKGAYGKSTRARGTQMAKTGDQCITMDTKKVKKGAARSFFSNFIVFHFFFFMDACFY